MFGSNLTHLKLKRFINITLFLLKQVWSIGPPFVREDFRLSSDVILTHARSGEGVAHNGIAPRGVSCRLGWVCETWGRGGGHL